jgi:lipoprotein-anchoring transpeptidase ErfK/SrfK
LWIALQGTDKRTEMLSGFGIHGTDDPDSIGRDASLGCIRLADEDIAELFALLCDGKSKVLVRP